jgi:4-hydroxy-2-oxoheptanedioate aldolase
VRAESLKERLRAGKVCLGTNSYTASPAMIEMIGRAGFDWVVIDCEHAPVGPYDTTLLENLLRAADVAGVTPLVRIPNNDETMILKVLDSGAAGIMVPHVNDAEDARRAVRATRYPPAGTRGMNPTVRSTDYYTRQEKEGAAYWAAANERVIVLALIEEKEAVENIEEIAAVDGIDVLVVGPGDLMMSLGETSRESPRAQEAMARIIRAAKANGKAVGRPFYYPDIEASEELIRQGFTFLTCTSDMRIFFEACKSITTRVAKIVEPQAAGAQS